MGKHTAAGSLGTAMANAPLAGTNSVGEALRDAAVKSSVTGAARLAEEMTRNPVAELFGPHVFKLPAKIKEWPVDKRNPDPNHTNATVAFITLPMTGDSGIECEMRVYRERKIVKRADGRRPVDVFSVSLPKGIRPAERSPITVRHLEAFQDDLLDTYFDWIKTIDASTIVTASRARRGRTVTGDVMPDDA